MIHRHRGNRRVLRMMAIYHKKNILDNKFCYMPSELGVLDKGKVHCSCNLCAVKSTKMRSSETGNTIHYNSEKWYKTSDRRKFDKLNYSLLDC